MGLYGNSSAQIVNPNTGQESDLKKLSETRNDFRTNRI